MIMSQTLTRETLQKRLASGARPTLIEALPAKYYLEGHLPGALHLPHDRVAELAASVVPDKRAEIVVYCASAACRNSHIAAEALTALGYANVAVYAGGKQDWTAAGLPLEQGGAAAAAA
jgi:rhodanese-related sulfurtransferase